MSLIDGNYALFGSNFRSIGGIVPDVTIEEIGTDVLRISDHPVEVGATVSDHAFKMPCEIVMRCGFSNSTAGYEGYVQDVYGFLLSLQAAREPLDIFTGKRIYSNMLVGLVNQITDETSENALMVTVACREVIITGTQAGQSVAGNQSMPQQTMPPANLGMGNLGTNPSMPAFTQIPGIG
jgi:hypothetical protein